MQPDTAVARGYSEHLFKALAVLLCSVPPHSNSGTLTGWTGQPLSLELGTWHWQHKMGEIYRYSGAKLDATLTIR